jgi:hypothetical protein
MVAATVATSGDVGTCDTSSARAQHLTLEVAVLGSAPAWYIAYVTALRTS